MLTDEPDASTGETGVELVDRTPENMEERTKVGLEKPGVLSGATGVEFFLLSELEFNQPPTGAYVSVRRWYGKVVVFCSTGATGVELVDPELTAMLVHPSIAFPSPMSHEILMGDAKDEASIPFSPPREKTGIVVVSALTCVWELLLLVVVAHLVLVNS